MKIKKLIWRKKTSDDPEKTFWYESQFKPPFQYCVNPTLDGSRWEAWCTNADGNDKKIGIMLTRKRAEEICQIHFEQQIRKFLI